MTFSMSDGTSVTVNVTLTGEHKVRFDSNGGDYKPEEQTITGGEKIQNPGDPKRDGYTFEGWYYTGEDGKEHQWDFNDPLHQEIELQAKWKKDSEPIKNTEEKKDSNKETPAADKKQTSKKKSTKKKSGKKEEALPEWGQYQIKGSGSGSERGGAAETFDEKMPFEILILLIASGSISAGLLFRNYNRRK